MIRGETPHFDFVAGEASRGLSLLQGEFGIPVGFVLGRWLWRFIASRSDSELYRIPLVVEASTYAFSAVVVIARAAVQRDRTVFAMMLFVLFNGVTESSGFTTLANICTFAFAIAVTMPPLQKYRVDYENDLAYQR